MEKSKVLFVDDEKMALAALSRELRKEECTLLFTSSGAEALYRLAENACKVIVADVKMPRMNGFELLSQVKELYPDMIRIVLSGHSDTKLVLEAVNRGGIDRYLTKPWNIDEVVFTLRQSIELFDLRREVCKLRKRLDHENTPWSPHQEAVQE